MTSYQICVKQGNRLQAASSCGICGVATSTVRPFGLFLMPDGALVCDDCARKFAPELFEMMTDYLDKQTSYQDFERLKSELSHEDMEKLFSGPYQAGPDRSIKEHALRHFFEEFRKEVAAMQLV
jgi:hypothetical protein